MKELIKEFEQERANTRKDAELLDKFLVKFVEKAHDEKMELVSAPPRNRTNYQRDVSYTTYEFKTKDESIVLKINLRDDGTNLVDLRVEGETAPSFASSEECDLKGLKAHILADPNLDYYLKLNHINTSEIKALVS